MLWDWVSNYFKPLKNQTKCTLNLNCLAVFESWPMRSLVVTIKKVDIPSCIAVGTFLLMRIISQVSRTWSEQLCLLHKFLFSRYNLD